MNFFDIAGRIALGSRLRLLTEKITADAAVVYRLYQTGLQPKWFPVFYVLSQGGEHTITGIAKEIGHSHPSVSKIIREMSKMGIVNEKKHDSDGRRNKVVLSNNGKAIVGKMQLQYEDVRTVIDDISAQSRHDLWKAMEEWEYLLGQRSFLQRVQEQKKKRESANSRIVPYQPKYKKIFKALNEEWIKKFFKMEAADNKALDDPKGYILNKGGHILVALYNGTPAGVCALIKMNDTVYEYELAKMAVSPNAQGKNIGWLLGNAIIEKAKLLGASKIYLESNTILKPAISLYQKLGFNKIVGHATPYERCNIQMELIIK